tara:strand:+ start:87 stop:467 length:381 start_codon:yes stop_codon:yes gene_type:complete
MLINGVDLVEIARIRTITEKYGERFLKKIYTAHEIAYCQGRAPQLASRFAAKEAVMKTIGTGARGVRWRDIEVHREQGRAPSIRLYGTALTRARMLGSDHFALSLSHSEDYAIAFVVAESREGNHI